MHRGADATVDIEHRARSVEGAQTMAEYAIVLSVILFVTISLFTGLSDVTADMITEVARRIP